METKTKILGLNAARLYGIDVEAPEEEDQGGRRVCPFARSRPRAAVSAMSVTPNGTNRREAANPGTGEPKSGHACKA